MIFIDNIILSRICLLLSDTTFMINRGDGWPCCHPSSHPSHMQCTGSAENKIILSATSHYATRYKKLYFTSCLEQQLTLATTTNCLYVLFIYFYLFICFGGFMTQSTPIYVMSGRSLNLITLFLALYQCLVYCLIIRQTECLGKFKIECRLNFEGMISHLILKENESNCQTGKILCPPFIKIEQKHGPTGLIRHLDGIVL